MKDMGPVQKTEEKSVSSVLNDVGTSVKDLLRSEVHLATAEIKDSASQLGRHTVQAALFGAILSLSAFPLLAFLVVGLGKLLGDNYWLSSLIIAVVCAILGGSFAYRAYNRIKEQDLTLPRTRESLERETEHIGEKVSDIKETAKRRAA